MLFKFLIIFWKFNILHDATKRSSWKLTKESAIHARRIMRYCLWIMRRNPLFLPWRKTPQPLPIADLSPLPMTPQQAPYGLRLRQPPVPTLLNYSRLPKDLILRQNGGFQSKIEKTEKCVVKNLIIYSLEVFFLFLGKT